MPKKNTDKEKPLSKTINLPQELITKIFYECRKTNDFHLIDQIGSPGTTKYWLKTHVSSRPCIYDQPPFQYPQLAKLTSDTTSHYEHLPDSLRILPGRRWTVVWKDNILKLTMTMNIQNSRVTRKYNNTYYSRIKTRSVKHESSTIDRYDVYNRLMTFTNVVECDGKVYALSLQGSLVVMEEKEKEWLTITGACRTRAVPSCSVSAKYFDEYLIGTRGKMLLVFLISRERVGAVDEVEVYKLCHVADEIELVTVERLGGRTLFLEKSYCLWANSREISCKSDCIYFFTDGKWWMYDLEKKSISMSEP